MGQAALGQALPSGGPMEELRPEALFRLGDRVSHGRAGQPQGLDGQNENTRLDNPNEYVGAFEPVAHI